MKQNVQEPQPSVKHAVKISFIPPSFFNWQYVFPMYFLITRLFSSMAFLSEMHSLGDIGWVGLGWVGLGWVGLGWVGLGWVGLGWVGLGWVGLG